LEKEVDDLTKQLDDLTKQYNALDNLWRRTLLVWQIAFGCCVGGLLLIGLIVALSCLCCSCKKKKQNANKKEANINAVLNKKK
jgi:hypothetical protein